MTEFNNNADYIAQMLKVCRKELRWTQANLAEAAGLSTRTIEKIETSKGGNTDHSLGLIAKALGVPIQIFSKPTDAQEKAIEAQVKRTVAVPVTAFERPGEFLNCMGDSHALHIDHSQVESDTTLELVMIFCQNVEDYGDIWDELSQPQKLDAGKEMQRLSQDISGLGYTTFLGSYRKRVTSGIWNITLLHFAQAENAKELKYLMVELESPSMKVD